MARTRDDDDDEDRPRKRRDDDERVSDRPRSSRPPDDQGEGRPRRRPARDDDDDDYDDVKPRRSRRDDDDDRPRLTREQVRTVARCQKAVILCILGNLATIPLRLAFNALPPELGLVGLIVLAVFYLAVAITATVFVFMLAVNLYSSGVGVLMGILTLLPCIGLIVLLIINSKATKILKARGVRVGLLGANMSDLP